MPDLVRRPRPQDAGGDGQGPVDRLHREGKTLIARRPGRALAALVLLTLFLPLAACRREPEPPTTAPSPDTALASALAFLLGNEIKRCGDFAESVLGSLQSWDGNGLGEASRREGFRESLRGRWRGWTAAVAVYDEEIEPRIAYLEGLHDPRAASLRSAYQAVRSYCVAVVDGSTLLPAEYRVSRNALREEAQRKASAAHVRSPSSAESHSLIVRIQARSEAAWKAGETSWAIEEARAREVERQNQEAFAFEMRSSPEDDPWAERRRNDPRGVPGDGPEAKARRVVFDWHWSRDQGRVRLEAGIRNVGNGPIEGGRAHLEIANYTGQTVVRRDVLFEEQRLEPGGETRFSTLFAPAGSFYRCKIHLSDAQGRPLTTYGPIETTKPLLDRGYN